MRNTKRLLLIGGLFCLLLAFYFGLTATRAVPKDVYGQERPDVTDWGKVALTLVLGAAGIGGLSVGLRKDQ